LSDQRLSAIRAAAAGHALVLDDPAIKVMLRLDNVAKEHPAIYAGTGTLQASVVRLYGVVVLLSGWACMGYARLCGVHRAPSLWARSRAVTWRCSAGATSLSDTIIIPVSLLFTTSFIEV
jgi:hypothetical protein